LVEYKIWSVISVLLRRVISAMVGIPVLVLATWLGGWWLLVVLSIIVCVASAEFHTFGKKLGLYPSKTRMILGALAILFVMGFSKDFSKVILVFTSLLFICLAGVLLDKKSRQQTLVVGFELFGMVYVGLGISYVALLRGIPGSEGIYYALLVFIITWLCDICAYFAGIRFGRHKLCPRFSPKKSMEGAVAGIIGAGIGAFLINFIVKLSFSITTMSGFSAVLLGSVGAIFGEFGDLFESMLKRDVKLKDSGNIIPGHGGMLDRFDSLLFVAPVVYYFITTFVI
jgi:phosphatidate cytidylyltransferase